MTLMNRPTRPAVDPLREFGHGPAYLFFYVSLFIVVEFVLLGYGEKPAIAC